MHLFSFWCNVCLCCHCYFVVDSLVFFRHNTVVKVLDKTEIASIQNLPSPFAPYVRTSHTFFGVGGTGLGLGAGPGIPEMYVLSFLWAVGAEGSSRHWLPLFADHFHAPHFSPARMHLTWLGEIKKVEIHIDIKQIMYNMAGTRENVCCLTNTVPGRVSHLLQQRSAVAVVAWS